MSMHRAFYKLAWDTRCRNIDVRRALSRFEGSTILDAGCGENGIGAFLPRADITGVDILPPEQIEPSLKYERGSIVQLPFEDGSFDVAVSVDVLEHLPADMRTDAVRELVRVARNAVIIAFPSGASARRIDEEMATKLRSVHESLPEWLEEHLAQPYPDRETIIGALEESVAISGRSAEISASYSENISVAKFLRACAARSKYIYLAANLFAGILAPLLPRANADTAYRSVIVADLADA
jgi:SAM-dependent methyltransferase